MVIGEERDKIDISGDVRAISRRDGFLVTTCLYSKTTEEATLKCGLNFTDCKEIQIMETCSLHPLCKWNEKKCVYMEITVAKEGCNERKKCHENLTKDSCMKSFCKWHSSTLSEEDIKKNIEYNIKQSQDKSDEEDSKYREPLVKLFTARCEPKYFDSPEATD